MAFSLFSPALLPARLRSSIVRGCAYKSTGYCVGPSLSTRIKAAPDVCEVRGITVHYISALRDPKHTFSFHSHPNKNFWHRECTAPNLSSQLLSHDTASHTEAGIREMSPYQVVDKRVNVGWITHAECGHPQNISLCYTNSSVRKYSIRQSLTPGVVVPGKLVPA